MPCIGSRPLWQLADDNQITVVTSELALLETLVQPIRNNDRILIDAYETLLTATELESVPITTSILRKSATLRASQNFKTPDAIHAATAKLSNCNFFLTNDPDFRRLIDIQVMVLSELV